jgi:hypothetical protein
MPKTNRVQRWREGKRQQGLKAVTIWLTPEEELRLKDVALQWHCSPSAVIQRAFAQVSMSAAPPNSSPPETLRMRELIQEEPATLQAEVTALQAELIKTQTALAAMQAEQAPVTETITEVVTDTLARDLPVLVRQLVEGLALEALGLSVTETGNGNVTETEPPGEAPPRPAPQRGYRVMRQRILNLLGEHPEGLSAEQIRVYLKAANPLGDTLQGMRRPGKVRTKGAEKGMRYVVA